VTAEVPSLRPRLGATLRDDGRCEFRVWAPARESVELHIVAPQERRVEMRREAGGYHAALVDGCGEGTRYWFTIGGVDRPDPASRLQPDGVHAPSAVVGTSFDWRDRDWKGIDLDDCVIYELHVGTFTAEGTFDAVVDRLDALKDLGVTAVELLPIGQFPGERNWGYDGTYVSAAQASYGGPAGLKRLVDACHARGLALFLDVVYNHLGPEGNYLGEFGPYFTDRYKTPWGLALNFDGPGSDEVRWYFIHSALQWIEEFHVDGLRVDAVHAIVDHSAEPFLQDLNVALHEAGERLGRRVLSIAESDLNDPRVITPQADLGLDFDSQWADDFHHVIHTLLTGERDGYYQGYTGTVSELARVFETGYLYVGQHSPYRGRKYGAKPRTRRGARFVVSAQNHDQVGNRMLGERLAALLNDGQVRLVAAVTVLSPFLPMLFMGEEYGEKAPFQYFTSHGDPDLIEAVRKGRLEEFDDFTWAGEPPDPHDTATFERSKLDWSRAEREEHAAVRELYRTLLRLRREHPALRSLDLASLETQADDAARVLLVHRWSGEEHVLLAFNFSDSPQNVAIGFQSREWRPLLVEGAARTAGNAIDLPPFGVGVWGAASDRRRQPATGK
jgi:maltooligosyltrehalose trehalohydrolase